VAQPRPKRLRGAEPDSVLALEHAADAVLLQFAKGGGPLEEECPPDAEAEEVEGPLDEEEAAGGAEAAAGGEAAGGTEEEAPEEAAAASGAAEEAAGGAEEEKEAAGGAEVAPTWCVAADVVPLRRPGAEPSAVAKVLRAFQRIRAAARPPHQVPEEAGGAEDEAWLLEKEEEGGAEEEEEEWEEDAPVLFPEDVAALALAATRDQQAEAAFMEQRWAKAQWLQCDACSSVGPTCARDLKFFCRACF
jgi:hypothetical protein